MLMEWVRVLLFGWSQFSLSQLLIHIDLSKYQNCITSTLRDQAFLQHVARVCFKEPMRNIGKTYRNSVPAI